MKKVLLSIVVALISLVNSWSQDINGYRNTITIDPLNGLIKTLSISYLRKVNEKYEWRTNLRISFANDQRDNEIIFDNIAKDPYWYYDTYGVRVGISKMLSKRVYVEPMLLHKYAYFKSKTLKVEDHEGETYDEYQWLSRRYNSVGAMIRSGLKVEANHFRFNFYYGLGYDLRNYHEEIFQWKRRYYDIPGDYPIKSSYWRSKLLVSLGVELGFRF